MKYNEYNVTCESHGTVHMSNTMVRNKMVRRLNTCISKKM